MREWLVYWLYDDACADQAKHGYIGATKETRLYQRLNQHQKNRRIPEGFRYEIIFRGSQKEALELEAKLRPVPHIGWNLGVGGFANGGGLKGIPKSPEHRAKQRAAALARYADPAEHERTSRAVKKGFKIKGIDRSGAKNSRYGVKLSEATKEKIRQRALERDMSGANNPNYRHGEYVED